MQKVKKREAEYKKKLSTKIWEEIPSTENPYHATGARCHGYDIFELAENVRFTDTVFLLLQGELPDAGKSCLFEAALICLINPGPRHPATRAAINAGVGKTREEHILPIALSVAGGKHLGGAEVEGAIRFLRSNLDEDPALLAEKLCGAKDSSIPGDKFVAPGFGSHFGTPDPFALAAAEFLSGFKASGKCLEWGRKFASALNAGSAGWLMTGVAGAVLADLGFAPRAASGLFQIASAPGLFAHGIEYANKPITDVPFPDGEDYVIEYAEKRR